MKFFKKIRLIIISAIIVLGVSSGIVLYVNAQSQLQSIGFVPQVSAPVVCDASSKGVIYFNSGTSMLQYCNGSAWSNVGSDTNNYVSGVSFSGTGTKTLTLTRSGLSNLSDTFTDIDTDTNTNAATICGDGTFLNGDGTCDTISVSDTNNYADSVSVTGTATKTITIGRSGLADLTDTFTDIDTDTNTNNYVDSVDFNTTSGVLTIGRSGSLADLTKDLDGRYLTSYSESDPQVGTLTNTKWCTTNGTAVNCTSDAPTDTTVDNCSGCLAVGTEVSTNFGNNNITGVDKIDVNTVDPVYVIEDKKYATYMAGMTGVKEETTGVLKLTQKENGLWKKVIDFSKEEKGSDLWIFWQTTDFGKDWDNLITVLTVNFNGNVWYKKDFENESLIIFAKSNNEKENLEVSYRLTAPRFDYNKWGNNYEGGSNGMIIPYIK
jgi:hypothetical protein